jgi:hypothetical protein
VADTDHGKAPRGPLGGPDIQIYWIADDEINLLHHTFVRVFRAEGNQNGVAIKYSFTD